MLDEPKHPRLRQYQHAHTKAWSARVDAADAFVFVTPEYNYGMPPALLNAIDYVLHEWAYKPAGFVSYGGISGGTRSVQMSKQVLTARQGDADPRGGDDPVLHEAHRRAGDLRRRRDATTSPRPAMLDELHRWAEALATLRPRIPHLARPESAARPLADRPARPRSQG